MKMLRHQDTEELTEDDYVRDREKEALNRLRNYLCDHLEPERFFPYLQSKNYLDAESCEQIRSAGTTRNRVNKMLDIIMRSGLTPLDALTKAIEKNGPTQKFVSKRIKDEFAKVCRLPANMEQLEDIRRRQHLMPTHVCAPQPPPYPGLPPNESHQLWNSSYASVFPTLSPFSQLHTESPKGNGKHLPASGFSLDVQRLTSGLSNGAQLPSQSFDIPKVQTQESCFPTMQSEAPKSSFMINAGHFETSDFPPGSADYIPSKPTDYSSSKKNISEIISDQLEEEQKISLKPGPPVSLFQHIVSVQEKELRKYDSGKTEGFSSKMWVRTARTPSEHDASVVCIRSSSTNTSPTPLSSSNTESSSSSAASSAKPALGDASSLVHESTSPKLRNMKSLISQSSGSIQPSCFTSSSFESCTTAKISQDLAEKSPGSGQLWPHGSRMHSPGRQFPTMLEPILSLEVPSAEVSLSTSGGSMRNPPTEHDDESIITPSMMAEEENSSLEISTDSEPSVEQK